MAMMSKTKNMLEGLVREGSFKWGIGRRSSLDAEVEEMMNGSPSGRRKYISELSPAANVVIGQCSRILDVSMEELQSNFGKEASDSLKSPSRYARSFLEYCCFRALAISTQDTNYLSDKVFRRLTFDMMLAWEAPSASSQPVLKARVDSESTVGEEAFSRIAPAIPIIADVITCADLFDVLTALTGGRLPISVYEKYLGGLERAMRKMKSQSESSLLSGIRSPGRERILDVDGTVTTQPVLQHVGISTWPGGFLGRLILTDRALYFEPLKVVSYDKAKVYDLADDLKQVVRPELTGPWGTRLFDKAVLYKSTALSEPIFMEFPELTGHARRDYWLAIIREILYAHRFIRKYQIKGIERDETLSKAVLGILRLQAVQELTSSRSLRCEALLMFNLCNQLPGGDLILEALASLTLSRELDRASHSTAGSGMYSMSASAILSNLGFLSQEDESRLLVGEIVVGEMTPLEKAVKESRNSFKKVEVAQATIDGVKVDGIDTNLAVMKELLFPITELAKHLHHLVSWSDPLKSTVFCCLTAYIIFRFYNQGRSIDEVKVRAPPTMTTVEQLLAVQNAISQVQEFVQDGNITLLKLRALLLAALPQINEQATDKVAMALVFMALVIAFLPTKLLILWLFLELFTRNSPPRRASTERWTRRLREWWFSIPAAPVVLERENKEDKKKK
ncbi:hypothetical protein QJS04_geneDACA017665 [Acorus gramineus]|uniref:Uncharacterized protein n=1 Tax=Acorus gramineus TaxID=55184 RepID=A0AAV9AW80_ACOGR|nr:hypothetical protein QJS04_geneDACA017665 [Acorus gramineus]